eukprot:6611391-Ditylum_brightwellii.AAC.1
MPNNAVIIGEAVTTKEWKEKLRAQKEQTTTSPSGKHLGHYKALISCDPADPQTYEDTVMTGRKSSSM